MTKSCCCMLITSKPIDLLLAKLFSISLNVSVCKMDGLLLSVLDFVEIFLKRLRHTGSVAISFH